MKAQTLLILLLLCGLLGLTGCQSLNNRIADHPELWQSLSAEEQKLVQEGKLTEGMSENAVYMAFGTPQYKREGSESGVRYEEWIYTQLRSREVMDWKYRRVSRRGDIFLDPEYGPVTVSDEQTIRTIRFVNGKVASWSMLRQ